MTSVPVRPPLTTLHPPTTNPRRDADKTHVRDKPEADRKANVHSEASKSGHEDRAANSGASQATSRRDDRQNNKRAEEEMPEAPRPIIGMNEERGTKGH